MALITGIGHTKGMTEIRSRHAKTMILSRINDHIDASRHVAGNTLCCLPPGRVKVVFWRLKITRRCGWKVRPAGRIVALSTRRIPIKAQFSRVGIVTIAARYPLFVHPALHKRPPDVHLIQYLSIRMIQTGF